MYIKVYIKMYIKVYIKMYMSTGGMLLTCFGIYEVKNLICYFPVFRFSGYIS